MVEIVLGDDSPLKNINSEMLNISNDSIKILPPHLTREFECLKSLGC